MEEFLVTVIIAWILFRLFRPVVFVQMNKPQKQYHNYYSDSPNHSPQGEIKVTKPSSYNGSNSNEDGEYVDFEELPKS